MQTVLNAEKDAEQVKQEVLQLYEKVRALGVVLQTRNASTANNALRCHSDSVR